MPYIATPDRPKHLKAIDKIPFINSPGELNFLLTLICKKYLTERSDNYQTFNDIIGALECCKQEFYSRVVAPYEDEKIKENGDVF